MGMFWVQFSKTIKWNSYLLIGRTTRIFDLQRKTEQRTENPLITTVIFQNWLQTIPPELVLFSHSERNGSYFLTISLPFAFQPKTVSVIELLIIKMGWFVNFGKKSLPLFHGQINQFIITNGKHPMLSNQICHTEKLREIGKGCTGDNLVPRARSPFDFPIVWKSGLKWGTL